MNCKEIICTLFLLASILTGVITGSSHIRGKHYLIETMDKKELMEAIPLLKTTQAQAGVDAVALVAAVACVVSFVQVNTKQF